jgi:hypothetical protein
VRPPPAPGSRKPFPLSSSLSSAKTAAANIDLMTVPYQNYASDTDTNSDNVLPAINSIIAAPGDGSSPASPQKILFSSPMGLPPPPVLLVRNRQAWAKTRKPVKITHDANSRSMSLLARP